MDTDQLLDIMMANWNSLSTSSSSSSQDSVSAAGIQQNRGILEPILEEETDEEEQARWSLQSYETNDSTTTSSGDSCDSVVQLAEVNFLPGLFRGPTEDQDTVSERDFLCPPKRRRQDFIADTFQTPSCLKVNHKIRFDSFEPDYHKKRYRLDDSVFDYPSDTESSLSRSSSLIQFESLERQLQNENHSFSSSSPLLNVALGAGQSNTAPLIVVDQDFERFIPLQLQLPPAHLVPVTVSIKTKVSKPYSSSSSQSDNNISVVSPADKHRRPNNGATDGAGLSTFCNPSTFTVLAAKGEHQLTGKASTFARIAAIDRDQFSALSLRRGKSSQEELSEDSGYCGDLQLQSIGSSTEGGCDIFSSKQSASSDELDCSLTQAEKIIVDGDDDKEVDRERDPKIAGHNYKGRECHSLNNNDSAASIEAGEHQVDDCEEEVVEQEQQQHEHDYEMEEEVPKNTRENKRSTRRKKKNLLLGGCQRIARSLPNIFLNQSVSSGPSVANRCISLHESAAGGSSATNTGGANQCASGDGDGFSDEEYLKVNSFPEGLNYLLSGSYSDSGEEGASDSDCKDFEENQEFFSNDYYFPHDDHALALEDYFYQDSAATFGGTIASKNLDLNQLFASSPQKSQCNVLQQQSRAGILSASYSNLTALDYSESASARIFPKMEAGNSKRSGNNYGRPTIANPEITLLDEISFNFDKNLSIINDRCGNFEPLIEDETGEEEEEEEVAAQVAPVIGILNIKLPPKPPPRRYRKEGSAENLVVVAPPKASSTASSRESLTFDRDPTNLVTCYAASLERCNFQTLDQPSTNLPAFYSQRNNGSAMSLQQPKDEVHAGQYQGVINKDLVVSTPNLSSGQEMQVFGIDINADNKARTIGNVSSRGSLYKEVSFNPIVSEISWRQQEDAMDADSLSEDSLDGGGSESDVESDGGRYRDDADDYFGLKKNDNFKDLDLTSSVQVQKSISAPVLPMTSDIVLAVDQAQKRQIITIKKTNIILTPPSPPENKLTINATAKAEPDDHHLELHCAKDIAIAPLGLPTLSSTSVRSNSDIIVSSENAIKPGESAVELGRRGVVVQDHHPNTENNSNSGGSSIAIMPINSKHNTLGATPTTHDIAPSKKRKSSFFSRLSSFRFSLKNSKKEPQTPEKKNGQTIAPVVAAVHYPAPSSTIPHKSQQEQQSATTASKRVPTNTFVIVPLKNPVDQLDHFSRQKLAIQRQLQEEQRHTSNNMQHIPQPVQLMRMPPPPPQRSSHGSRLVNNQPTMSGNRGGGIIPLDTSSMSSSSTSSPERVMLHKKPPLPKHPPRVIGVCAKKCADANSQKGVSPPTTTAGEEHRDNNNNQQNQFVSSGVGVGRDSDDGEDYKFASHNPRRVMQAREAGAGAKGAPGASNAGSFSKIGLIETNLDTHETIISGKTRSLMELHPQEPQRIRYSHQMPPHQRGGAVAVDGRQSLGGVEASINRPADAIRQRPHKSMEFLLDKENQLFTLPPENELQKIHETPMLSEHQLRVQASLQKLNIPDWYRAYNDGGSRGDLVSPTSPAPPSGSCSATGSQFNYRKRGSSGVEGSGIPPSSSGGHAKWTGLSSKTTSLSSLGGATQRYDKNSSLLLSPSSHSHHGGTTTITTGYSRWSTSHLNSAQTSPSTTGRTPFTRGNYAQSSGHSFIHSANNGTNIRGSYRQPYLGWRSQEKLSQGGLRTPAERLASSLIAAQPPSSSAAAAATNGSGRGGQDTEIQSSIKEVTSAIVHYVNDQTNRNQSHSSRSRSTSPRKCWVESSFVGTGRLDSPQTPPVFDMQPSSTGDNTTRYGAHTMEQLNNGSVVATSFSYGTARPLTSAAEVTPRISSTERSPRPGSASLEDVLSSLLGLPKTTAVHHRNDTMFNSYQGSMGANRAVSASQCLNVTEMIQRRRSEGDARQKAQNPNQNSTSKGHEAQQSLKEVPAATTFTDAKLSFGGDQRRLSFDSSECVTLTTTTTVANPVPNHNPGVDEMLKCRHPRCEARTSAAEAKKTFKQCHNCSHLYCSRECRRQHWEKHRKACLHSRVSALCRQVLSACKDEPNSLRNLTLMARRGYLQSGGRGIVRILFRSPEAAESFLRQGYQKLGEASYVRWPDLLPAEMGPELYSELLRLSTEYKPESKMLIYVAICVVSEVPTTKTSAPVRWERQLVSRCAKLKLCKSALRELDASELIAPPTNELPMDILILTFNASQKIAQEKRELIMRNVQEVLRSRGVVLRKNYPEVWQRLNTFVEGITDRFVPVTVHPRDANTGREFVCIIMPNTDETMRLPNTDSGQNVQIFDLSCENLVL